MYVVKTIEIFDNGRDKGLTEMFKDFDFKKVMLYYHVSSSPFSTFITGLWKSYLF